MTVNDPNDPVIAVILDKLREYQRLYDFGTDPFDRGRLEPLYKKDEAFTAYDVAPPVEGYAGWAAYATAWTHLLGKFSEFHFNIREDDIRAFHLGDTAWVSVAGSTSGKSVSGDPFRKELRVTLIFVRDGDDWLITHEHVSAPRMFELAGGASV